MKTIAILLLGLAAACGSSSSQGASGATGTIAGSLHVVGGPAPGRDVPVDGTITATDKHHRQWRTETSSSAGYTLNVPVGSYAVSATASNINNGVGTCSAPNRVTVKSGATVQVIVQCVVP